MNKLKRIYTNHFPMKGYTALTIWPWVFIRRDRKGKFTTVTERHETTHALQQRETLLVFFFLLYGIEWLVKLFVCRFDNGRAYRSISFEQEAYATERQKDYNDSRRHYAWTVYVFTLTQKKG